MQGKRRLRWRQRGEQGNRRQARKAKGSVNKITDGEEREEESRRKANEGKTNRI